MAVKKGLSNRWPKKLCPDSWGLGKRELKDSPSFSISHTAIEVIQILMHFPSEIMKGLGNDLFQ